MNSNVTYLLVYHQLNINVAYVKLAVNILYSILEICEAQKCPWTSEVATLLCLEMYQYKQKLLIHFHTIQQTPLHNTYANY